MPSMDRIIWNKFRIKRRDNLPYTGWTGGRNTLAEFFADVGFNVGAEVGTRKGNYAKVLCGANPDLKLFCVDPYTGYGRVSDERQNKYLAMCEKNLVDCNVVYVKKKSMEALQDFQDGSLDFVYIDALHDFDNVIMDVIGWTKKVKSGGIISGHDYFFGYQQGVIGAVDAYTKAHNIQNWYITHREDDIAAIPSFFWVNP